MKETHHPAAEASDLPWHPLAVVISFAKVSNDLTSLMERLPMAATSGEMHKRPIVMSLLVVFAALVAVAQQSPSAAARPPRKAKTTRVQTAEEAIAADARWYAQSQGVSQEEAVRRLRIQSEMGGLIGQLRRTHKARLAGIVIDHQPVYRVRVRLTGTLPVATQEHALGGSRLQVVFEVGAKATLDALITSIGVHLDGLKRLYPTLAGVGTDESTGEIVLHVYAPDARAADAAREKLAEVQALLGQPARIEITSAYPTTH
jgi:hypothetical protein